jgi:hypothetical protein
MRYPRPAPPAAKEFGRHYAENSVFVPPQFLFFYGGPRRRRGEQAGGD